MKDKIRVLSFGAGVQSTTLLMMCLDGTLPAVDAVVFADTGWEPQSVYTHLAWCIEQCGKHGVEFVKVERASLRADSLAVVESRRAGERGGMASTLQIPAYSRAAGSEEMPGILRRYCTSNYKVQPVNKAINALRKRHRADTVDVLLGISLDEIQRMKVSREKRLTYLHPLAWDLRMTRHACLEWMAARGYPTPPRSACVVCPYRSNEEWRHLRDTDIDGWLDAVAFDEQIRLMDDGHETFLHRSGQPLASARIDSADSDRAWLFNDECEGMCGM